MKALVSLSSPVLAPVKRHAVYTLYQYANGLFCAVSSDGRLHRSEEEASACLSAMGSGRLLRPIGEPDVSAPFLGV